MKDLFALIFIIFIFSAIPPGFTEEAGFVYDAKGKRDPFVPAELVAEGKAEIKGKIEDLCLEGILWDRRGNSFVILNDEILKSGDEVMGFKIVRIEKEKIILSSGEDIYSVRMETE